MNKQGKLFLFLSSLLMLLAACDSLWPTPIGKITENPREYAGKSVVIKGEVNEIFSLLVVKYFSLKDNTGEMIVVSAKPLPKRGATIKVKGKVEEAFSIGDQQLMVLVEEET